LRSNIKRKLFFFFEAQNSMLVKLFIVSDAGNIREARQISLQQQRVDAQHCPEAC